MGKKKYQPRKTDSVEYRLLHRTIKDEVTNCWTWTGSTNGRYGHTYVDGVRWFVHRAAFKFLKGIDPKNMLVCHKCDNPLCINPDHLFLGTHKDNTADMIAKGRGKLYLYKGVNHSWAKFDEKTVKLIREAGEAGLSRASIARYFKVSPTTISNISLGKIYKDVI